MRSYGPMPFLASRSKREMPTKLLCRMQTCQKHKTLMDPAHQKNHFCCAALSSWRRRLERCERRSAGTGVAFTTSFEALEGIAVLQQLFLKRGGSESRGPVSVKLVTGSLSSAHRVSICGEPWTHTRFSLLQIVSLSVSSDAYSHLWRRELHHSTK